MLSKTKICSFLEDVVSLEMQMHFQYLNISKKVNNSKYKKIFLNLANDELEHTKSVKALIEYLENKN